MTNYEKIKNMSVEEMAETFKKQISFCCCCPVGCKNPHINQKKKCLNSIIKWLGKEATNDYTN